MPDSVKFTVTKRASFAVPRFNAVDMRVLAQAAVNQNTTRWDRATNVRDAPAKPLQIQLRQNRAPRGYAIQKRRKGGQPIRDWKLTGQMRAAFGVLSVTRSRAVIGWNSTPMMLRATFNQALEQMFGISPADEQTLFQIVRGFLAEKLDLKRAA